MDTISWALWGLLGAFVYAAPRLLVGITEGRAGNKSIWPSVLEFGVALTFGPIIGAGLGPFSASYLHRSAEQETRAIALVIGMVANPVAPVLVKLATGDALGRLGGLLKGDQSK